MLATILTLALALTSLAACSSPPGHGVSSDLAKTVADTLSQARAPDMSFISWVEHLVDDEGVNGGEAIRGGDGLAMADLDKDGFVDIASVHEDSHHVRIAFGSKDPDDWQLVTLGKGAEVGAVEDVAIGDLNADGWPDLVAACEEAHLIYFQNPGPAARSARWPRLIPSVTKGRGSWLRAFIEDFDGDGALDVIAPNKGAADLVKMGEGPPVNRPTSLFTIDGDPLSDAAWKEHVLLTEGVPNTAMPIDIDADGDPDVLAAARIQNRMFILENRGPGPSGGIETEVHEIALQPGFEAPAGWRGRSSAFNSAFEDMDGDGRVDLIVSVQESDASGDPAANRADLGWLRQPQKLSTPWTLYRIGNILPDWVTGIAMADIDGDGDKDAVVGGYSGLNILARAYSGASRDEDDPSVTASSTVGRIAWFENPGDPKAEWRRHDISRRVRGMVDGFIPHDMDRDGDIDLVATRGNSGEYDGVFWLEQVRSKGPRKAFVPARNQDSRALALPPDNWFENYSSDATLTAPNKAAQDAAREE